MSFRRRAVALGLAVVIGVAGCSDEPRGTIQQDSEHEFSSPTPSATRMPPSATPTRRPSPPGSPAPADRPVVLALGDSVTFGVGVPDPRSDAFPAIVADELEGEARVLAVPGETAAGFLEQRIDDVRAAIEELGERIELVTIGLGANEILRIRREPECVDDRNSAACQRVAATAAQEAAAALDAVVEQVDTALAEARSAAPLLVLAYYNPDVEPVAVSTIVGADGVVGCVPDDPAPGLNDRIACVAERRDVALVDLYAAFLGREEELTGIGRGDVHPTVEGHAVIADAILAALHADR